MEQAMAVNDVLPITQSNPGSSVRSGIDLKALYQRHILSHAEIDFGQDNPIPYWFTLPLASRHSPITFFS